MPDPQPNCCCPTLPLDAISIPSYDCSASNSPDVDYWEATVPFTSSGCGCDLSPLSGLKTFYPFGFCQWVPPSNQTPALCVGSGTAYDFSFSDYRIFYNPSGHPTFGNLYLRLIVTISDRDPEDPEPPLIHALTYGADDPVYLEQPITLELREVSGCFDSYPDTVTIIPYRS